MMSIVLKSKIVNVSIGNQQFGSKKNTAGSLQKNKEQPPIFLYYSKGFPNFEYPVNNAAIKQPQTPSDKSDGVCFTLEGYSFKSFLIAF